MSFSRFAGRQGFDEEKHDVVNEVKLLKRLGGEEQSISASSRRCTLASKLLADNGRFSKILHARSMELDFVNKLWLKNDMTMVVAHITKDGDDFLASDLLRSKAFKTYNGFNLSMCAALIPRLTKLLTSEFEVHVEASVQMCSILLKNFAPVIHSMMDYLKSRRGKDGRERRFEQGGTRKASHNVQVSFYCIPRCRGFWAHSPEGRHGDNRMRY